MKYLVTGNAGFIGFHVAQRLLSQGEDVIGVDNVNEYYDPSLKEARLAELEKIAASAKGTYTFLRMDIADRAAMKTCFSSHDFDRVIHLAAQAGVRYSLSNPQAYIDSNLVGFGNILEGCRQSGVDHLIYASSSSIYGSNTQMPFTEDQEVGHPQQLYAATKRANEVMAHSYAHLYKIPMTGLRFFTVYGPWGRPDMALFKFTKKILDDEPIPVYGYGKQSRDFTYIDDIVEGILKAAEHIAAPAPHWDPANPTPDTSDAPFQLFNIGNGHPEKLTDYIKALEEALGKEAQQELLPMQPGDIPNTYADTSALREATGYQPSTSIKEGVARFVEWYLAHYQQHPVTQDQ